MDLKNIEEKMNKTISVLEENLAEVRAGRANPAILNKIMINYYGVSFGFFAVDAIVPSSAVT